MQGGRQDLSSVIEKNLIGSRGNLYWDEYDYIWFRNDLLYQFYTWFRSQCVRQASFELEMEKKAICFIRQHYECDFGQNVYSLESGIGREMWDQREAGIDEHGM